MKKIRTIHYFVIFFCFAILILLIFYNKRLEVPFKITSGKLNLLTTDPNEIRALNTKDKKIGVLVQNNDRFFSAGRITLHGYSAINNLRKSYNLKINNEKWLILGFTEDRDFVRTIFAEEIFKLNSMWPYGESYLNVYLNNDYLGFYRSINLHWSENSDLLVIRRDYENQIKIDNGKNNLKLFKNFKFSNLPFSNEARLKLLRLLAVHYILGNSDFFDEIFYFINCKITCKINDVNPWDVEQSLELEDGFVKVKDYFNFKDELSFERDFLYDLKNDKEFKLEIKRQLVNAFSQENIDFVFNKVREILKTPFMDLDFQKKYDLSEKDLEYKINYTKALLFKRLQLIKKEEFAFGV